VFIRQLATVHVIPFAKSLGVPSVDTDIADSDWDTENASVSDDSSLTFGKRELFPHLMRKQIRVSNKLIRNSPFSEEVILSRMAKKISITEEKAFLAGTGAQQPLGVFTADANGISTGRDVSTGNSATEIGANNLSECKYSLKSQFRKSPSVAWVFHPDAMKQIALLKDGQGAYLFKTGLALGDPDQLLGFRVLESEFAPNTFTSGKYVGVLGDFENYWIADSLQMEVQKLVQLHAATAQTGFIANAEVDGMPAVEAAFARMKLA